MKTTNLQKGILSIALLAAMAAGGAEKAARAQAAGATVAAGVAVAVAQVAAGAADTIAVAPGDAR